MGVGHRRRPVAGGQVRLEGENWNGKEVLMKVAT